MHNSEEFVEDAISEVDALSASERFLIERREHGIVIRLFVDPDTSIVNLASRDHTMAFLAQSLDYGHEIVVGEIP